MGSISSRTIIRHTVQLYLKYLHAFISRSRGFSWGTVRRTPLQAEHLLFGSVTKWSDAVFCSTQAMPDATAISSRLRSLKLRCRYSLNAFTRLFSNQVVRLWFLSRYWRSSDAFSGRCLRIETFAGRFPKPGVPWSWEAILCELDFQMGTVWLHRRTRDMIPSNRFLDWNLFSLEFVWQIYWGEFLGFCLFLLFIYLLSMSPGFVWRSMHRLWHCHDADIALAVGPNVAVERLVVLALPMISTLLCQLLLLWQEDNL